MQRNIMNCDNSRFHECTLDQRWEAASLLLSLLKISKIAKMSSGIFKRSHLLSFWKVIFWRLKGLQRCSFLQERRNAQGKQHQHHRGHVKVGFCHGNCLFSWTMTFRRVREARSELRKFIRESKKVKTEFLKIFQDFATNQANPAVSCHLQYDKAYVNRRSNFPSKLQLHLQKK